MSSGPHPAPAANIGLARVIDHTGAAARLVASTGSQLQQAIEDYALHVGEALGVDSLILSTWSAGQADYRARVEWYRAGFHCVVAQRSGDHLFGQFPWFAHELSRQGYFILTDATDLPEHANAERRHLERTGRRAMVSSNDLGPDGSCVTLTVSQHVQARDWTPQDVKDVRVATSLLASALRRLDREGRSKFDFRQLFRNEFRALAVIDASCERLLAVNDEFARLHGYEAAAMAGESLRTISPERNTPHAMAAVSKLRELGHYVFDVLHRRTDGSVFPCRVDARWIEPDGASGAYLVVVTDLADLTDLTSAGATPSRSAGRAGSGPVGQNAELQSLGLLAGGIAHDFNNLLVGILGNAELARIHMPEESVGARALDDLRAAATRASGLANQMLAYAGKRRLKPEPLDLRHELQEMGRVLSGSLHKNAAIRMECDDAVVVVADATHTRQILMNLIVNASDAMAAQDESGEIVLRAGRVSGVEDAALDVSFIANASAQFVYLEVEDHGCGMSETVRSRIFDAFFTTKVSGRGLGMATLLECVRQHAGGVSVRSTEGEGTTIRVYLPDAAAHGEQVDRPRQRRLRLSAPRSGNVLIAEDEAVVRKLVRRLLERRGLTVVEAANGVEARELLNGDLEFAFAMVDVSMPQMDGITLINSLPATNHTPVVLMSGYTSEDISLRRSEDRTVIFLQKPFEAWELDEVVDRFVGEGSVEPGADVVE